MLDDAPVTSSIHATPGRKTAWTQTGAAVAALVLCVLLIAWMAWAVLRQIEDLSTANSDNLQWSLSQADVEFLRFRLSIQQARDGTETLDDLRRRFDIFYSRMSTIENGDVFRDMRQDPEFDAPRQAVRAFLDNTVPLIDGSDEALRGALPDLARQAETVGEEVRALSLSALTAFATLSDERRAQLLQMLALFGAVLMFFFLALSILAYSLFRLFRISERRSLEIEQASERMRTVVETSPNAILVTDKVGTIREFNSAAERLFGHTVTEARGRSAIELLVPNGRLHKEAWKLVKRLNERRRPTLDERTFEITLKSRSGADIEAEISIDRAVADTPVYVCYVRDISRSKLIEETLTRARDQALAAERAKSKFLAVMSHEMRTPLNGLIGSMQLMDDVVDTRRQKELLGRMKSSGNQLLMLVNDVLDLAKYEAGKLDVERAPFSIREMLDDLVDTSVPMATSLGNEVNWRWEGAPGDLVFGDARKIRQVLLNYVSNAVKFTRNGSIDIEVEFIGAARKEVEFRVFDTGIGIDEKDQERIFDDFETLDSSYAREVGGTGLGLGIAKRFAKVMNGETGAESEPGEGSLFWLRVPLPEVKDAASHPAEPDTKALPVFDRAVDVLLVEDNHINRRIAREMLEAAGHQVTEAFDGKAGVEAAEVHAYDVILMDISMPVMDGTEATAAIRDGNGASALTPIIALTAHAMAEERQRFFDLGMDACLNKPVDRVLLLQTIAEVMGKGTGPATTGTEEAGGENAVARNIGAGDTPDDDPTPDLIKVATLEALFSDLPQESAGELLKRFVADAEGDIALISQTDPADPELQEMVHRCAGACSAFGMDRLRAALHDAESRLKQGGQPSSDELVALAGIWRDSRAELVALLSGQGTTSAAAPTTVTTLPISARLVTELS